MHAGITKPCRGHHPRPLVVFSRPPSSLARAQLTLLVSTLGFRPSPLQYGYPVHRVRAYLLTGIRNNLVDTLIGFARNSFKNQGIVSTKRKKEYIKNSNANSAISPLKKSFTFDNLINFLFPEPNPHSGTNYQSCLYLYYVSRMGGTLLRSGVRYSISIFAWLGKIRYSSSCLVRCAAQISMFFSVE